MPLKPIPVDSLVQLLDRCDTFYPGQGYTGAVPEDRTVGHFVVDGRRVGHVRASLVQAVREHMASSETPVFLLEPSTFPGTDGHEDAAAAADVHLSSAIPATYEARTGAIKQVIDGWRASDRLKPLRGWRNELYPLYTGGTEATLSVERSASALFGMATFGVHINILTPTASSSTTSASGMVPDAGAWKMWIARRSLQKPTYPGMLDNSVAGGIPYGLSPREAMIKECEEEASLPAHLAEKAVCTGCVSYINDTVNGVQPEVQYVYDLILPPSVTLCPNDGEVECFYLWDATQLREALMSGAFKPNCALVILDFLLRHGLITPELDPAYLSFGPRLHRTLGLYGPGGTRI